MGDSGDVENRTIDRGELRRLVLQPDDLPPTFRRFDEGPQVRPDNPGGTRADPARFGREDGWKARYQRRATRETTGALVVESRIDVFDSVGGAQDDVDAARSDLEGGDFPWQQVDTPQLGDEAVVLTHLQPAFQGGVRYYVVVWRESNATASILASGFARRFDLADVMTLARKQQRRIERASD